MLGSEHLSMKVNPTGSITINESNHWNCSSWSSNSKFWTSRYVRAFHIDLTDQICHLEFQPRLCRDKYKRLFVQQKRIIFWFLQLDRQFANKVKLKLFYNENYIHIGIYVVLETTTLLLYSPRAQIGKMFRYAI